MKIYLCSRVAYDAHDVNDGIAKLLRAAGHEVFVPHEAPYNTRRCSSDEEIYQRDMAEMLAADACVIVGRIGVDCAFEVGWFQNHGTPMVWYVPKTGQVARSPMLHLVKKLYRKRPILDFLESVEQDRRSYQTLARRSL